MIVFVAHLTVMDQSGQDIELLNLLMMSQCWLNWLSLVFSFFLLYLFSCLHYTHGRNQK